MAVDIEREKRWAAQLENSQRAVELRRTIGLDIGCGEDKRVNFIGMDAQDLPGVDIVWDAEDFPWPIADGVCHTIIASHLVEHIKPWCTIPFFNECWRVIREGGQLLIATPYAGSYGYWQDPTHCNGFTHVTFQYFDPTFPLYVFYKPKPWKIAKNWPVFQTNGNLEIIMFKLPDKPREFYLEEAVKEKLKYITEKGGGTLDEPQPKGHRD